MRIKSSLTKFLFCILPKGERQRMANDLITWLNHDLPQLQRQEMVNILQPNLLEFIRQGQIGLPLLVYHHLMRFFTSHSRKSDISPEVPPHLKSV